MKVFDFGLSTEVNPSRANKDGTYKLTGFTGSPIYMAPEVAKLLPYNFKADVYSFGILLWQIMTTKLPFEKLTMKVMEEAVLNGNHRPKIDPKWSDNLSGLMEKCWAGNLYERPSFKEVGRKLQNEGFGDSNHSGNVLDVSTKSYSGILQKL